jgi:chromosome partitioning protein
MQRRIISIANQKGGVGKTTTAVNLCASLAAAEHKTLLIDMDPQGNASSSLGVDRHNLHNNIYQVMIDLQDINQVIHKTELKFLDFIPSNTDLFGAEIEMVSIPDREKILKKALSKLNNNYSFIIIDCPPALGLLTVNSLTAADSVLIPLQCEYFAMEGLSQLQKTIGLIQKSLNPALQIEGILLTMFDKRNNLSHQVAEEVKNYFGDKVFKTIIPRNVRLSEAPGFGKPIILYDIKSTGAVSYLKMARELLKTLRLTR